MKKIFLPIALIATVAVSCGRDQIEIDPTPVQYEYTFAIEDGESKATLDNGGVLWETNDRVGMFLEGYTGYANVKANVTPKQVTLYSKNDIPAGSYAYAYYPYNPENADKASTKIILSNIQEGGSMSAMPMAGIPFLVQDEVPVSGTSAQTNGVIQFVNLGAIIDFRIFSTNSAYASETVKSVTFHADGVTIAGEATMDLTALSDVQFDDAALVLNWSNNNVYDYVKVNQTTPVAASKDAATPIYMVVGPGTYPSGTITVVTDAASYTFNYTNKELGRNSLKHYNMNLANASRVADVVETTVSLPYTEAFTSSRGEFEIEGGTGNEWQFKATYGATVSGYYKESGASSKSRHDVVTSIVSPWIDLRPVGGAKMTFSHAIDKYLKGESSGVVKIQKEGDSGWTVLPVTFPELPSSTYSEFLDVEVDLSNYAGKKVKVKFEYTSTTTDAGTWEIRNLSVEQTAAPVVMLPQYLSCIEIPTLSLVDETTYTASDEYENAAFISYVDPSNTSSKQARWYAYNTTTSTRRVASHTYYYNSRLYRNYTVMMDQTKRCALWVAYPMHQTAYPNILHNRVGEFNESTSYDPAFETSWQSSGSTSDYNSGNGYARGHLCASADRQALAAANWQTFFYSNQVPQWQNSFNSGVWSSLEEAVQNNAPSSASDTLYVVSGVLFESSNTGSSNDGGIVARPSHFYKLLMRCTFSGKTITDASGVAYIFTNEAHTSVTYYDSKFRTTIDAIEDRTGFDFFPNVPDELEDAAESSNASLW